MSCPCGSESCFCGIPCTCLRESCLCVTCILTSRTRCLMCHKTFIPEDPSVLTARNPDSCSCFVVAPDELSKSLQRNEFKNGAAEVDMHGMFSPATPASRHPKATTACRSAADTSTSSPSPAAAKEESRLSGTVPASKPASATAASRPTRDSDASRFLGTTSAFKPLTATDASRPTEYSDASRCDAESAEITPTEEIPAITSAEQYPAITSAEQYPAITSAEQYPAITSAEQYPAITSAEQYPAITSAEQYPAITSPEEYDAEWDGRDQTYTSRHSETNAEFPIPFFPSNLMVDTFAPNDYFQLAIPPLALTYQVRLVEVQLTQSPDQEVEQRVISPIYPKVATSASGCTEYYYPTPRIPSSFTELSYSEPLNQEPDENPHFPIPLPSSSPRDTDAPAVVRPDREDSVGSSSS